MLSPAHWSWHPCWVRGTLGGFGGGRAVGCCSQRPRLLLMCHLVRARDVCLPHSWVPPLAQGTPLSKVELCHEGRRARALSQFRLLRWQETGASCGVSTCLVSEVSKRVRAPPEWSPGFSQPLLVPLNSRRDLSSQGGAPGLGGAARSSNHSLAREALCPCNLPPPLCFFLVFIINIIFLGKKLLL